MGIQWDLVPLFDGLTAPSFEKYSKEGEGIEEDDMKTFNMVEEVVKRVGHKEGRFSFDVGGRGLTKSIFSSIVRMK